MPTIWITRDCRDQPVEFIEKAWNHIVADHPELEPYRDAVRLTVERPNFCTREADGSINYYRLGTLDRWPQLYLHVLARVEGDMTQIKTAWPAKRIDPFEEMLCVTN